LFIAALRQAKITSFYRVKVIEKDNGFNGGVGG
jgi:hypothetical protein